MARRHTARTDASLAPDPPADLSDAERFRAERDHWRHLFDQLAAQFPEPVIVVDDDGRLTHWNREQAAFTDTDAEAALGRPAHEVIGTKNKTETLAETVAETGEPVRESDVRTVPQDDGEEAYVRAVGVPLTAPDGETAGAFEFVHRVTELVEQRKSVETVQRRVREDLDGCVSGLERASSQVTRNVETIAEIADAEAEHVRAVDDEIGSLSATTEEVAASVETISSQSSETADLAADSEESIAELLETVERVADASDRMASDAEDLADRVSEIDDVVTVIDDIADQINVLALNASIEAARAGEAGEGFAVVADEVKSLAAESKAEADRIAELIGSVSEIAADTVDGVERTATRVDEIESRIGAVRENQREIQSSIAEVSNQLEQIAAATDEQATSAEHVSAELGSTVDGVERIADEIAELAAANREQTERVTEIGRSVDALERSLSSAVTER
jgi:methyl-accepting chemotaxis protein